MSVTLDGSDTQRRIGERLNRLRTLAASDREQAVTQTWAWFHDLGARAVTGRAAADAELTELFRCGSSDFILDGVADGLIVATLIARPVDRVVRVLTTVWTPWLGKYFDASTKTGDNRVRWAANPLSKLLWPTYTMTRTSGGWSAFSFHTRTEPSALDPDMNVLAINYKDVGANPRLIIRRIHDELVEIVPGAYLGRIVWQTNGRYVNIGWFAIRT